MARLQPWSALYVCIVLCSWTTNAGADVAAQGGLQEDLKDQIEALGKQIKEAEAGRLQAQKLLESGKEKQKSFESEVAALKASATDSNKQASALQQQISLLKAEVKSLKDDEALHADLKTKFQAVIGELDATKDTLAGTLKQLADSSSLAHTAEGQLAQAEKDLQAAKRERDESKARLAELQSNAADVAKLQRQLEGEQGKTQKLQAEIKAAHSEKAELASRLSELQATAKAAEKEGKSWKSAAEKAKREVASAELKLKKALQEHTATQSALIQAEAKATEAAKQMELLLTSWLPHWLEQRYAQVAAAVTPAVQSVQPALESAWHQGKQYSQQGRAKALWALGVSRAKTVAAWKTAQPTVDRALTDSKRQPNASQQRVLYSELRALHELGGCHVKQRARWLQKRLGGLTRQVSRASSPHLAALTTRLKRAFSFFGNYATEMLAHPQVLQARRTIRRTFREIENLIIRYMKRVPQLKRYARRPFVTYVVYAGLAAPFVTILLPLLLLGGDSGGRPKHDTRKAPRRDDPAQDQQQPSKNKAKKARRISVGDEHVRVP